MYLLNRKCGRRLKERPFLFSLLRILPAWAILGALFGKRGRTTRGSSLQVQHYQHQHQHPLLAPYLGKRGRTRTTRPWFNIVIIMSIVIIVMIVILKKKLKRGDVLVLPAPPRLSMFNIIIVTNIVIIVLIIIFILTFFNQIERVNLENKKV